MKKFMNPIGGAILTVQLILAVIPETALAQIPGPNAAGVATGHIHLNVTDVAKHTAIWTSLGAKLIPAGRLQLLTFPGMIFLLTERTPTAPSGETTVNHVGFLVHDYEDIHSKLAAAGATIVLENTEAGQLIASLPDGTQVEMQQSAEIQHPIEFHHIHLAASDQEGLRDWYVKVFGAEASSRRDMPSAVVPGGRVDIMDLRTEAAPKPTRGTAIDHIGFEVADLHAFLDTIKAQGIKIDLGPIDAPALGLRVAFITDPVGTYIELTEGLDNLD
ncbi:MAG: hypothetical protein A3J35_01840 [Gammaproteobacteria bacterium RIFCSPLOWO2_02_FULL_52_10]|nr:MAG: hypothetical protein A3J35_01840 [Gammaproteobacteria bacterium RIFCSPLOWO2_02_FULL_52_10]